MTMNWGGAASGAVTGATAGSALGPWGTLGGAVLGGVGGLFMGGGDETTLEAGKEDYQTQAAKALTNWGLQYLSDWEPGKDYTGKFTAPMSGQETKGMELLDRYLASGTGDNYQLAADEIRKTLTEDYDPYKSQYYKDVRRGAGFELEDAIDEMRRGQGARGTFFQDTSMREENKLRERTTNYLSQMLGSMKEKERDRRLQAVPQAMNLEKYEMGLPLAQATAATTIGSLPRLIEQSDLEAKYQDFLRKQKELSTVPGVLQGVFGTGIDYGVKTYESEDPFSRLMGAAGPLLGSMYGSSGGTGTAGTSAGTQNVVGTPSTGSNSSFARLMASAQGSPSLNSIFS